MDVACKRQSFALPKQASATIISLLQVIIISMMIMMITMMAMMIKMRLIIESILSVVENVQFVQSSCCFPFHSSGIFLASLPSFFIQFLLVLSLDQFDCVFLDVKRRFFFPQCLSSQSIHYDFCLLLWMQIFNLHVDFFPQLDPQGNSFIYILFIHMYYTHIYIFFIYTCILFIHLYIYL